MRSLTRSLGWPLTTLVVGLVAVWIAGMIALPLATMVERAFVFQDRADDLTVMGTRINRLTRDVATIELDVKMLEREAANAATEEAAADSGLPAPSISGPSALAPTLTPSITPTPSASGTTSDLGPKDINAEIASLRARKREIANDIVTLKREEERLQIEKANASRYSLQNFSTISPIHAEVFFSTLGYASLVTVLAFLICYPVAYAAATAKTPNKLALLLLLLVIPYAINELLRTFAWVMILEREGVLNTVLSALGLFAPGEGPRWVASNGAVFTVMIYAYLLFMVFPLHNTLDTLDKNQIEAARDLGASAWQLHARVVIPHAKPGIAMGAIMVFMLSAGSIAVPDVIGRGMHPDWFTQIIYRRFFESANWNQGSAYSLMLLGACIVFVLTVMAAFRVNIRVVAR